MNPLIPLGVQSPDIAGSFARGQGLRQDQIERERTNALAAMLQQQGPAIMAGDTNALGALAGYDPSLAVGIQSQQLGQQATRQGMQIDQQRLKLAMEAGQRAAQEHGAQMSAFERAQAAEQTGALVQGMAYAWKAGPEEWSRAAPALLKRAGFDGESPSYEDAPYLLMNLGATAEAFKTEGPDPVVVAPGSSIVDKNNPSGGAMFTAPVAEPKEPETVRALRLRAQAAGLAEGTPQYNDFMLNGGVERTETPPSGYRYDAARNLEAIPGGPADPARPSRGAAPTEGERKAAGFLYRMEDAERVLSEIPVEKQNPNIAKRLASSVVPEGWVLGENEEVARQAQVDWTRAKLRFESGAVIGEDEAFQEAAAYFPRPGDSDARIKAKARSRQNALEQMRIAAGRSSVSNEAPADTSAQAVPQEIMDQLQGAPAGTTVLSPDGRTLTWDGQELH